MVWMKPRGPSEACLRWYQGVFGRWWTSECLLDRWSCSYFGSRRSCRCCIRRNLDFLAPPSYFADLGAHRPFLSAARCLLAYPSLWFLRRTLRHPHQRSLSCLPPLRIFNNETEGDTILLCWHSLAARACSACAEHRRLLAVHLPGDPHDW